MNWGTSNRHYCIPNHDTIHKVGTSDIHVGRQSSDSSGNVLFDIFTSSIISKLSSEETQYIFYHLLASTGEALIDLKVTY